MFELILATISNCAWAIVFALGISYCHSQYPYYSVFEGREIYSDPEHCYYEKWTYYAETNKEFSQIRDEITKLLNVPRFRGDKAAKIGLGVLIFCKFATTEILFSRSSDITWGYWLIIILPTVIFLTLIILDKNKTTRHIKSKFGETEGLRLKCSYPCSYIEEKWYAEKAMTDIKTAMCLMNDRIKWLKGYQRRQHEYVTNWFNFTTTVTVINLITSFLWLIQYFKK